MNYLQVIKTDAAWITNQFLELVSIQLKRTGVLVRKFLIGLGAFLSILAAFASLVVLAIGFGDGFSGWYAFVVLGGALYCATFFFSNPKQKHETKNSGNDN